MLRSASRLLVGVLGCLLAPAPIGAHESGATRVTASFGRDGNYAVELTADAGTLLSRLELARKQPRTTPTSAAELQRGFDGLCDEVPRHLSLAFDGVANAPRATCVVDAESGAAAADDLSVLGVTVTLRGAMPPGAGTFQWQYDLASTRYSLTMKTSALKDSEPLWLEGGEASRPVLVVRLAPPPSTAARARNDFAFGFSHILPGGLGHVLFLVGMVLLSRRLRPMLWQLSAFTLAQAIAFGLTLYGVIAPPASILEPFIAVSILYVAVENLVATGLTSWRVALVTGFGLLHGVGFADALREMAPPDAPLLARLVAFNAGVAVAQLAVVLLMFILVRAWARRSAAYRRSILVPGSAAIALAGLLLTLRRFAG